jgi:hypothetical protein
MSKKKAIEILKNLNKTLEKIEGKEGVIGYLSENNIFSLPSMSKSKLVNKINEIKKKYNL